jgi:hypothetical protein
LNVAATIAVVGTFEAPFNGFVATTTGGKPIPIVMVGSVGVALTWLDSGLSAPKVFTAVTT